jgi:hypothetical protein
MSGREMRESRKLFAAKLNEAHSIIARLSKWDCLKLTIDLPTI